MNKRKRPQKPKGGPRAYEDTGEERLDPGKLKLKEEEPGPVRIEWYKKGEFYEDTKKNENEQPNDVIIGKRLNSYFFKN